MGRVHLGWDPMLCRLCAVKLLQGDDPDLHLRFLREARCQAKVAHPNVCRVYEAGMAGNRPFIAMELLEGVSLAELGPQLGHGQLAELMADVAGAVDAAHRLGLIHRDLKPANILVTKLVHGALKAYVVDFGLAQDLLARNQTLSWAVMGTPAFMSPEQAKGEALGPATDIYSLGATLYALLTGQPPFESTTLGGLITMQSLSAPKSVRHFNPSVPKDLETIAQKCLEREPQRRYTSAKVLEEDLRHWLAGEPILARSVGPIGRLLRWVRRKPALAASLAAGLIGVSVLGSWNIRTSRLARAREQAAQRFGMDIRDAEHLLRIERLLPVHDIRPAESRLRARMEGIRNEMGQLGGVARGPGLYAIGRGHLALREYGKGVGELESAWRAGYKAPEVAFAIGMALLLEFEEKALDRSLQGVTLEKLDVERKRLTASALDWVSKAEGAAVDHPDFGAAMVAQAEGRFAEADSLFARALGQAPWLFEGWVGRYRNLYAWKYHRQQNGPSDTEALFKELTGHLEKAQRIAPSDDEALSELARLSLDRYIWNSARKNRSWIPLHQARQFLAQALAIRPDSHDLLLRASEADVQQAFLQLSTGEDPGTMLRERARLLTSEHNKNSWRNVTEQAIAIGWLHRTWWVTAESDWRFGRDPRPALKEAELWRQRSRVSDIHQVFPLLLDALDVANRGEVPYLAFKKAEDQFVPKVFEEGNVAFQRSIFGEVLLEKAGWLSETGRSPRHTILKGIEQLNRAAQDSPEMAYTFYHLPRLYALQARTEIGRKQDPTPSVKAALAAAARGLAINPRNAQIQQAAADAHLADGQARAAAGRDPGPALAAARRALDAANAVNPRDFRSFLLRAEVEKEAAAFVRAQGGDPTKELERMERACRKGLGIKGDERRFRKLLAEAKKIH